MTICWDCRQRDGSHLKDCSATRRMRPAPLVRQVSTGRASLEQIAKERHTTAHHIIETTREAPEITSRASVTFVQRHSVMSDDDVAWCREQLAARWK